MRYVVSRLVGLWLVGAVGVAFADKPPLDCSKKSLADAVDQADAKEAIFFTGVCAGPIVIRTDGVSLTGAGAAVIDGHGGNAVTVAGAHGVALSNIEIRNGLNGVLGINGAHVALTAVNTHHHAVNGISLQTSSSAVLTQVTTASNGLHGLDLETGSSATITGAFTSSSNRVFGINVNGSALTFSKANATISGNALGLQVATAGNAFLNDSATVLNVSNNFATGLTVVSGAHMVSFGGTITAAGNGVNGISVNSKGGLDLDAGSVVNVSGSGRDGVVLQEQSVMTIFNIPQFSGVPGFSTLNSTGNGGSGVGVLTGSTLTLVQQAKINSTGNAAAGLLADNGAGLTLRNTVLTGNTAKDLILTFGTRADLQSLTLSTWTCDPTVLVRGTSTVTCPH